jgi:hypothetical protein
MKTPLMSIPWLLAILLPVSLFAQATDLLTPQTQLVASAGAPSVTEYSFSVASATDLVLTLTDLQVPQALATATVVVTQGGAIVGTSTSPGYATLAPPATSATVSLTGASGDYTVRVFGAPNTGASIGTFTVCVAPKSSPSSCVQADSISGNISTPGTAHDPTVSTVSQSFTVATSGAYTVTFADDAFPAVLAMAPQVAIFQGSQQVALPITSGSSLNLSAGTYELLAIAQADATTQAGLYGLKISGSGGTLIDASYPVGTLAPASSYQNTTAQSLTLAATDFQFPAALASVKSLATAGSQVLGTVNAGGSVSFATPVGAVQVWSFASAGSDAGTYEIDLKSSSAVLAQRVQGVSLGNSQAFAFVAPIAAGDAGTLQATAADFDFPNTLPSLKFAVAQNAAILKQSATAGSVSVTVTAVPVVFLVNAAPPSSGNGLFDVNLQTASNTLLFDKTQSLGSSNAFFQQTVNFGGAQNFDVSLTDLKFPAQFQDLALVVSSGGSVVGKIVGGGTFSVAASPGTYQLTFVATPAMQQQYGMYAVQVVPSAPTVTLSASPTSVAVNTSTTLSWTTTAATSCTASGGSWSGSKAAGTGSEAVVVTAMTSYTLTCTGPGGSKSASVTVDTTTPPSSSHGGGSMDIFVLLTLLALLASRFVAGLPGTVLHKFHNTAPPST